MLPILSYFFEINRKNIMSIDIWNIFLKVIEYILIGQAKKDIFIIFT